MMNQRKNFIEAVDRCGGVDDHAGFAAMRSNETKGTIEMNASFLVDGNPIGAGLRECADEFVRSFNHEMTIKRDVYGFAKGSHDRRPDRDVRDEVTIHHVEVKNGRSSLDDGLCLCAEPSEVGGKNGGSELDHGNIQLAA
jgi:hypothetical protein